MSKIPGGELRFLIHQSQLLICINHESALHSVIAYIHGMISKDIFRSILEASGNAQAEVAKSLGVVVLGGYCEKTSDEPLKFKYLGGSRSLPPANEEAFNSAQTGGNIIFDDRSEKEMMDIL